METLTGRLTIAADQLAYTLEQVQEHGLEDGNLADAAQYLLELMEHGTRIASLALTAVEQWPADHRLAGKSSGLVVEEGFGHLTSLCEAAQAFACTARHALAQLAT
jgi:hypothetical protein